MKKTLGLILGVSITLLVSSCSVTKPSNKKIGIIHIEKSVREKEVVCVVESREISRDEWIKRPIGYEVGEEARFFVENAKKSGVIVRSSGVQYKELRKGCGARPKLSKTVKVRYHMTLLNGKVVDSSFYRNQTPSFVLGSVIPGWSEAVSFMQPGAVWEIYIPSYLAYGSAGMGPVPRNAALLFTVELIEFY